MTERVHHTQHPDEDLLLDVALGQADLPTRHDVGTHLGVCARCQVAYDQLADAIEHALPAVPRVAPPPDFEQAVLARLDERRSAMAHEGGAPVAGERASDYRRSTARRSTARGSTARGSTARRRTARRWLVPLAAGLVGLAGGASLSALILNDPPSQTITASTPIVTGAGDRVGGVTRTIADGEPALVVALDQGPVGPTYTCRLVLTDGSIQDVGEWQLRADGVNSWVVADPGAQRVELIAESGRVWSSADL